MSITGLKLSQINLTTDKLKDSDFFYYVSPSAGPVYESKKGDLEQLSEYIDIKVGDVLRQEFTDADTVLKQYTDDLVKAEELARIADVNQEEADRIAAVAAEANTRLTEDNKLDQKITNEVNARIDAVQKANQSRADGDAAEAAARNAADAEILEALATEATQRGSADTALSNALANEVSARATAEAALTKAIADEGAARVASDASLIDALTEEETARVNAVATLQASISNESAIRSAAITALTTALSEEIETRADKDAEEVVARTAAIRAEADARTQADLTEKVARENADQALTTALNTEISNRTIADAAEKTARESAISTEKLERIAADQANLTTFNDAMEDEINARIAAISAEEQARIAAVSAEEQARLAAVSAVATRVATIESNMPVKADLVGGKIPASQLPAYVDDVLEVSLLEDLPVEGETGKIYVVKVSNLTYRWSGTSYVEISKSLAIGESAATAHRGDHGKSAYDHSQITTGNPHGTTKEDLGLGNVDNTADADKPISTATQEALDTKVDVKPTPFHTAEGDYGTYEVVVSFTSTSETPVTKALTLTLPASSNAIIKERRLVSDVTNKTVTEVVTTSSVNVDSTGVITATSGSVTVSGTTATLTYTGTATTAKVLDFVTVEWIKD